MVLDASLKELIESKNLQWIFVGGKGGVGKTTTACSIAIQLSQRRKNVLILSTDPAHNLSDAFTQKFSSTPTPVNGFDNLSAMEIDSTQKESSAFKIEEDDELGFSKIIPELIQSFPGIDEAMSFGELMQAVQTMKYDCIVFDTAPTGHTLRLLSFPDLLDKAFKKLNSLKDKLGGAFDLLSSVGGENQLAGKFEHMRAVTASIRDMFQDPTRTTFVCVCIPEFLSVYETERLVQELSKQDIDASYIVVNQILFPIEGCENLEHDTLELDITPSTEEGKAIAARYEELAKKTRALSKSHFARRRMQSKYLAQIMDLYGEEFHVVAMPLGGDEVRGKERLQMFGKQLLTPKEMPIVEEEDDD